MPAMNKKENMSYVPPEGEKKHEQYELHVGGFTISGRSGTGKTRLSEGLSEALSIPNVVKTGNLFREMVKREQGGEVVGFKERDLSIDEKLDEKQRELITEATPDNPIILEGRLAGFLSSQMRHGENVPTPNVVTLLLTGNSETRFRRILNRQREKEPGLSLRKARELSREREKKDREQWQILYPDLHGIDPFSPTNRDKDGKPMYDIIVDTNNKSQGDVLKEVLGRLEEAGYIRKKDLVDEVQPGVLPQTQQIYPR